MGITLSKQYITKTVLLSSVEKWAKFAMPVKLILVMNKLIPARKVMIKQ